MAPINHVSLYDSKYEQVGCIGHGGFSSVFLARTRNSDRKVVIKVFRVQMDGVSDMTNQDDEPPDAFTREISIMKKLQENKDPSDTRDLSIIYFEKWFQRQNLACIVMNYCSGGTLAHQIKARSKGEIYNGAPYSERRIAWYALQLVEALTFMHDRRIFHSDVKSSNVLIDWESGGKIILADLGSAIGADDEEIFGFTKSYAPPELLLSHENDDYDGVAADKVDAFGLGCILFELVCCKTLADITHEEDTTLAGIITEKGLDAVVDEKCGKLPWLPSPDEQEQNDTTNQNSSVIIGYSFELKSLLKSVLEPDPNRRWKPLELLKPLREDPNSPLLASILTASHTPVPGDIVSMDNIQLGMFVQYGPDFRHGNDDKDIFEVTSTIDVGESRINFQSITAMDEYRNFSFEEMRLVYYLQQEKLGLSGKRGIIGVISKIDPDALYAEAIWPIYDADGTSLEGNCYRIGAGNLFELQVGPILCNDFFDESNLPPRKTGLIPTNLLVSQMLNKFQFSQPMTPGLLINGNAMVVCSDPKTDYSLIAPLKKVNIQFRPHNLPVCPSQEFVGPNPDCSPCPDYWNLESGTIVEEDCLHLKDAVTELFFSERGGMNIQEYEIVSVKRVQIEQLWSSYAQTIEDIASEAWGLSNERYLFLGTGRHSPEELLQTDPENFFHNIVSTPRSRRTAVDLKTKKIYFSESSAYQDSYSFGSGTNDERKLVLSRVALGRVKNNSSTSPLYENLAYHSVSEQMPDACMWISIYNPFQAYPEYIISYKSLPQPPSRRSNSSRSSSRGWSYPTQRLFSPTGATSSNTPRLYQNIELPSSSLFRNIQLFNTPGSSGSSSSGVTSPPAAHTLSSLLFGSSPRVEEGSSRSSFLFSSGGPIMSSASSSATTATSGIFGRTTQRGTRTTPYEVTPKLDGTTHVHFNSITAMAAYESKSFEELRMEDYTITTTANSTMSSSCPAANMFSSPSWQQVGQQPSHQHHHHQQQQLPFSSPRPPIRTFRVSEEGSRHHHHQQQQQFFSSPRLPRRTFRVREEISGGTTSSSTSGTRSSDTSSPNIIGRHAAVHTGFRNDFDNNHNTNTNFTTTPAVATATAAHPFPSFSSPHATTTTTTDDDDKDKKPKSTITTTASTNTSTTTSSTPDTPNNNNRSNTKKCVVCLEKDVRRILLPCGHPCLCEVCGTSQGLKKLRHKCPECRSTIKDTAIIYGRVVDD